MRFKIFNLSIFSFTIVSFLLLFLSDVYLALGQIIALVVFLINMLWITNHEVIFYNFIITTLAWGASINLQYRLSIFMLSDIALVMLIISMLINIINGKLKIKLLNYKENIIVLFFVFIALIIGVISGAESYNIFQDLKLFIYIFIPYIYLIGKKYKENPKFYINLLKVLCICVFIIVTQEVMHIFKIGVSNMISVGFANRDVGIQVQIVTIMAVVTFYANQKVHLISKVKLILFEIICFIACLLSFTRTIWISYIISILIVLILNKNTMQLIKKIVLSVVFFLVVFIIFGNSNNEFIHMLTDATIIRFNSILISFSTNMGTLGARIQESNFVLEQKIYTTSILWGKGFGDLSYSSIRDVYICFNENSILYYTWKYGLIFSIIIIFYMLRIIKKALISKNLIILASCLSIGVYMLIGNFSGNLNSYYLAPVLSIFFAYLQCSK